MSYPQVIELHQVKGEARIDSRIIAEELGNIHIEMLDLVQRYQTDFEEFGVIRFQTQKPPKGSKGGRPERFALLTEDQAYLLLTYARNTPEARRLKVKLVKAFSRYRDGKQVAAEYLPLYHTLHQGVKALAVRAHEAGSTTPEEFFHVNVNRLINRAFGVESGARGGLSPTLRVMMAAAQAIATETLDKALGEGLDHRAAYARVKESVERYAAGGLALIWREGFVMAALTNITHPATLLAPSHHAAVGRRNPNSIGAQRHIKRTGAFFTPVVRLHYGGLGGARFGVAGIQYAGFRPPFSPSPIPRRNGTRRLQPSVLEPAMSKSVRGQNPPKISHSSATIPNFRVCEKSGRYVTRKPLTDEQIIQAAKRLLERRVFRDTPALTSPALARDYLTVCLGGQDRELFGVLFLDTKHHPLTFEPLFFGTLNTSYVHVREVVRAALRHNAGAVILAHNHPSGSVEPSDEDRRVTRELKQALWLVSVRVLDHFVIGGGRTFSFAEHGLLDDAPAIQATVTAIQPGAAQTSEGGRDD
ncbi:JAB domain-containing protein [Methylomagnum sp.]